MTKYDNKLLSVLCALFALSAPETKTLQILSGIYGLLIILFLLASQVGIFVLKFQETYPQFTNTMMVLDVLQCSILVLHNCAAILKSNWHNDNAVQSTLARIKCILKVDTVHSYKYIEVVTAHFVIVILLLFLLLTPMHQELGVYKSLNDLFFCFNIGLELLVVMQIFYTNRMIMDNFRQLNIAIVDFVYKDSILTVGKTAVDRAKHQRICFFIKVHSALTETMSVTCENFGIQLSFLCALLIVVTIQGVNVALKTAMSFCSYYDQYLHLISTILGIVVIIHIMFICFIVFSCSHIHEEAKKSSSILSRLLIELQALPEEVPLKKLLLIFINYCKCSDHFYSVLGFIDINHETMLILLECFSLYIVLVLQFP